MLAVASRSVASCCAGWATGIGWLAGDAAGTVDAAINEVVMPNEPAVKEKRWAEYLTTVDEIERESGYDFLTAVQAPVQDIIEAKAARVP